jgi:hypothetical protein
MKIISILLIIAFTYVTPPELSYVRNSYINASNNTTVVDKLYKDLLAVSKEDNKTLVAYKGAILTLKAKYAKSKSDKKEFFKEGVGFIEYAVLQDSQNIEIRTIRLSVQENSPKFLKYHKNIPEDKQFILNNYKKTNSKEIQKFIKEFVLQSESFNTSEKELF